MLIDGEIFNLAGLARELSLGQASPEDVVAAGYERWSRDVLRRLRGSFALAVVDEREGRALIAADQAGGHSIYYRAEGNRLVVASEIRPLLGLLPSRPAPDPVSVVHWFSDNAAPTGRTLYQGIQELPGGDCFELSNLGWRRTTYWRPRYEPDAGLSTEGAAELLWDALLEAVRVRLQGSGLVGLVMSGGIDSAAVAAAAVEAAGEQGSAPRGYSAVFPGYPDQRVDESERIDALVKSLDLESTQVRIDPGGAFALSVDWLEAWELPLGGPGYLLERPLLELAAAAGGRRSSTARPATRGSPFRPSGLRISFAGVASRRVFGWPAGCPTEAARSGISSTPGCSTRCGGRCHSARTRRTGVGATRIVMRQASSPASRPDFTSKRTRSGIGSASEAYLGGGPSGCSC